MLSLQQRPNRPDRNPPRGSPSSTPGTALARPYKAFQLDCETLMQQPRDHI
jgi:hypothetical protein